METKFEWNDKTKELVETRTGNELVDSKQQKVEGKFINKVIYTEVSARSMIKELERQISEHKLQEKAMNNTLEALNKNNGKIDPAFLKQFNACMAQAGIQKEKEALEISTKQVKQISSQLVEIKKAMGGDF